MTDTDQTSTGAAAQAGGQPSPATDLSADTREVIVELLTQHQALLTELRWAYDQLERVQEVDIAALKQRVSELEQRRPARTSSKAVSTSASAKLRKRVEFTLAHPDKAVRVAGRKISRPFGQVARRAGLDR